MARALPIIDILQEELDGLRFEFSVELPKIIEVARDHGDLKENAEYHAAKERQGFIHARISQIEQRMRELSIHSFASIPRGKVGYGSIVEVEDVESGDISRYHLVFPEEIESKIGGISMGSPVAQALLRREEGDEVTIHLPAGSKRYEIVSVVTIHEQVDED